MGVINTAVVILVGGLSAIGISYALNTVNLSKWPLVGKYDVYVSSLSTVAILALVMMMIP